MPSLAARFMDEARKRGLCIDTPEGPQWISETPRAPINTDSMKGTAVLFDVPALGGRFWLVEDAEDAGKVGAQPGSYFTRLEIDLLSRISPEDAREVAWLKAAFGGTVREVELNPPVTSTPRKRGRR